MVCFVVDRDFLHIISYDTPNKTQRSKSYYLQTVRGKIPAPPIQVTSPKDIQLFKEK